MRVIVALSFIFLLTTCRSSQVSLPVDEARQLIIVLAKENLTESDTDYISDKYSETVATLEGEATKILSGDSRFKWKSALGIYRDLEILGGAASKHPALMLPTPDYATKIAELEKEAAEDIYQEALTALSTNSREGAKIAYFQFQEVDQLVSGYKQVAALKDEALLAATTQVMLYFTNADSLPLDSAIHEIERLLYTKGIAGPFINFIPFDVENDLPRKHLASIHFDQVVTTEKSVNHFTQVVEKSSQKQDFEIEEALVYFSLPATVEITELELDQVLLTKPLLMQSNHTHLTGKFDGDIALLNEYQRKILDADSESVKDSQISSSLRAPIKDQITRTLLDFYQNY